jgi:hypothetical protein
MGLVDNKKNIFTTINTYSSFLENENNGAYKELKNKINTYSSINNKRDVTEYLIDVLKNLAGTDGLKELIGGMFSEVIDTSEAKIKTALKKHTTQYNSGQPLPNNFQTNGVTIDIANIDIKNKFKTAPNSDGGSLIYNDSSVLDFDNQLYKSIQTPGVEFFPDNMGIGLKYNDTLNTLTVKPNLSNTTTISEFFNGFIDNANIVNKSEITTNVMDNIYGTLSKKTKKNKNQILKELKLNKSIDNLIAGKDSLDISKNDLYELVEQSKKIENGYITQDMGCGLITTSLSFSGLSECVTNVINTNNKLTIGDSFENTLYESNNNIININKSTVRDGFFTKLVKMLVNFLIQTAIAQPQIKLVFLLMEFFQNDSFEVYDEIIDYLNKFRNIIACIAKEMVSLICEYIFNLAVSYMSKLILPVAEKIIKEKLEQYTAQMGSLVGLNKISDLLNNT